MTYEIIPHIDSFHCCFYCLFGEQFLYYAIPLQDPNEKIDLAKDPDFVHILEMMKSNLKYYLKKYPLQPLATNIPTASGVIVNGALTTCWCKPPSFADRNDCPA